MFTLPHAGTMFQEPERYRAFLEIHLNFAFPGYYLEE
jgi:hypothetical protein